MFDYIINFCKAVTITIFGWFTPQQLPTTIPVGASILTLVVAYLTYKIAIKAYTQVERESPWELIPLRDNFWLLKRLHPSVATVYGYCIIDFKPERVTYDVEKELKFYNDGYRPLRYFLRGTSMIIEMPEVGIGSSIALFYQEHKNPREAVKVEESYKGRIDFKYVPTLATIQALGWGKMIANWKILKFRYFRRFRFKRMNLEEANTQIDFLQLAKQVKLWETRLY